MYAHCDQELRQEELSSRSSKPKACRCEIVLYYAMNEDPWPIIAWSCLGRLPYNVAPHLVLNGAGAYKIVSTWSCSEFQNN
jgi:hypothetical protein